MNAVSHLACRLAEAWRRFERAREGNVAITFAIALIPMLAFVGAAVRLDSGYRFIATDMKLDDLDGSIWPTLADVRRLARSVYLGGRAAPVGAH